MIFVIVCLLSASALGAEDATEISAETTEVSEVSTFESFSETTLAFTTELDNSTCDNEGNCNLTTRTPKTTKKPVISTTTVKPDVPRSIKSTISSTGVCPCDFLGRICDVNCCCDADCTFDQRQVFGRCDDEESRVYDTSFCEYTKYLYKNNTPYEWKVDQNGLFCVLRSNLPPHRVFHEDIKLDNLEDADIQKTNKFHWPTVHSFHTDKLANFSFKFIHGSNLLLVEGRKILPLEVPDHFHTDSCSSKRKINILEDVKTDCSQYYISNDNKYLGLGYFARNISFMTMSPQSKYFSERRLNLLGSCPKDVCTTFEVKTCDESLENCLKLNKSDLPKFSCLDDNIGFIGVKDCNNMLKILQYRVYHNGTKGIKKIELLAHLKNQTFQDDIPYFQQHFQVKFFWYNHSHNFSLQRSGSPGYVIGKPILIGNLVKLEIPKKNVSNNLTIIRNPLDIADNFLVLPTNKKGSCFLDNSINTKVQFGYNFVSNCKIKAKLSMKPKSTTREVCKDIQRFIFKSWSVPFDNTTKIFGKYGNADTKIFNDWQNVSYTINPKTLINNINSIFTIDKTKINCANLYTLLKIDIFHSRTIVKDLHDQQKILWVTFSFENKRNLIFIIDDTVVDLDVSIRSEVVFYDVTTKKIRKFADPPSLDIRLPYDFFYPFVKIDSLGISHKPYYSIVYLVVSFLGICLQSHW